MKYKNRARLLSVLLLTLILSCSVLSTAASAESKSDATQSIWKKSGKDITVTSPSGSKRKYHCYSQKIKGDYYYSAYGCITTAVSISESGFGKYASPKQIHKGSSSSVYSEKYALKKIKAKYRKAAISLRLASQILTDMGIPNKRVNSFSANAAINEIRNHLKAGKPVIVKVSKKTYNGIRFTVRHHALVLIGLKGDTVVFVNPWGGKINHSSIGKVHKNINLTVPQLVTKLMFSSKKHVNSAYVSKPKDGGGYILVG